MVLNWLESTGQWKLVWSQPTSREQCEFYGFCGAFETCNQNIQPFCTCLNGFSYKSADDRRLSNYSGIAITAKADVYSYGMMLFELVSGRRNSEQSQDKKFMYFPTWAASVVVEGGDVFNLLDHRLENNADEEELRRIARVACWCIQDAENHRPTMGQVVQILEGVLEVKPPRVPRLLQAFTDSSSRQSSQPPCC
ncbi:hypothetical protein Vadar_030409 [Vaccinium darrowii]|uniref:Uncharacterized protein n=1 Tax=Vaccinium darrowii TaxID=229202 RepID=A0ACB7ZGI0_9ERIC|nr:hypothetical protein Vadar_030409 [Vaccinium darrowii]